MCVETHTHTLHTHTHTHTHTHRLESIYDSHTHTQIYTHTHKHRLEESIGLKGCMDLRGSDEARANWRGSEVLGLF